MSSIMDVVKPDISRFMEDGKFDVDSAFENYLCSIQLFIFPARKMLEASEAECDSCASALAFLEALDAGLGTMQTEIVHQRKAGEAA
jgi:hypothetical protein